MGLHKIVVIVSGGEMSRGAITGAISRGGGQVRSGRMVAIASSGQVIARVVK